MGLNLAVRCYTELKENPTAFREVINFAKAERKLQQSEEISGLNDTETIINKHEFCSLKL